MPLVIVLIGALALAIAAGALRAPGRGGPWRATAAFLAGLVLTATLIKSVQAAAGFYPADPLARYTAHAARLDPPPSVMFLGSSMSRNAIDDALLTRTLRAAGYDAEVVSVSIEGGSLLERDMHLRQYLRERPAPDVVFLEIAYPLDRSPTYVFGVAKFSDRAIKQFGPRGLYWAIRGLAFDFRPGVVEWAKHAGLASAHGAMNLLNVGALRNAKPLAAVEAERAYDPIEAPLGETPDAAEISAGLIGQAEAMAAPPAWSVAHRRDQVARLEAAGARVVGYYSPPVAPPEHRAYVRQACALEPERPCLLADDPVLLASLDGPYWNDPRHLLRVGAETYTHWLSLALIDSGVLPAANAPAPTALDGADTPDAERGEGEG